MPKNSEWIRRVPRRRHRLGYHKQNTQQDRPGEAFVTPFPFWHDLCCQYICRKMVGVETWLIMFNCPFLCLDPSGFQNVLNRLIVLCLLILMIPLCTWHAYPAGHGANQRQRWTRRRCRLCIGFGWPARTPSTSMGYVCLHSLAGEAPRPSSFVALPDQQWWSSVPRAVIMWGKKKTWTPSRRILLHCST